MDGKEELLQMFEETYYRFPKHHRHKLLELSYKSLQAKLTELALWNDCRGVIEYGPESRIQESNTVTY